MVAIVHTRTKMYKVDTFAVNLPAYAVSLITSPKGMSFMQWQAMFVIVVLLPVRRLPKKAMLGFLGRFSGMHNHSLIGPATVLMVVGPTCILL